MAKQFFDLQAPSNAGGFGMFTAGHFLWLGLGALAVLLLCLCYRRAGRHTRRGLRCLTAFSALGVSLTRAGLLLWEGAYGLAQLPLHLCAIAVYLSAVHALRPKALLGQFLYALCLPGALAALLFPGWNDFPLWHFMTAAGFATHFLLVGYVLMQLFAGELVPRPEKAPLCLAILLALAVPLYVFDRLTGMNFMFLNWPSPGSPLEWFLFLGRPGYLAGCLPLLAAAWALLYLPFCRRQR